MASSVDHRIDDVDEPREEAEVSSVGCRREHFKVGDESAAQDGERRC